MQPAADNVSRHTAEAGLRWHVATFVCMREHIGIVGGQEANFIKESSPFDLRSENLHRAIFIFWLKKITLESYFYSHIIIDKNRNIRN